MAERIDSESESEEVPLSRDESLRKYIQQARERKALTLCKTNKAKIKPKTRAKSNAVEQAEQINLSVGRMIYDSNKRKPVADKEFGTKKVLIYKKATYSRVVQKCQDICFPGESNADYYLADSAGVPVQGGEHIVVDLPNGKDKKIPWALDDYLFYSGVKYQSKAKINCVRKIIESDEEIEMELETIEQKSDSTFSDFPTKSSEARSPAMILQTPCVVETTESNQVPYLQPLFMHIRRKKYSSGYIHMSNLTQEDALLLYKKDDPESMYDLDNETLKRSGENTLLIQNPCDFGFVFHGFKKGETMNDQVLNVENESGNIVLKRPSEGAKFEIYVDHFCTDDVALIMCMALNGYHSVVAYNWQHDGIDIGDTAVVYVNAPGRYTCEVTGSDIAEHRSFIISYGTHGLFVEKESMSSLCQLFPEMGYFVHDDFGENHKNVRLMNVIGRGSFGIVHKAVWRGVLVAAKVIALPACDRDKVLKEIETLKKVQHPNILSLMGAVIQDSSVVMVTNFVNGENLHNLIFDPQHPQMDWNTKLYVTMQVAQAVAFLHICSPPIIHLDVKPANLLVEAGNHHVYIADFGLARILNSTQCLGTKTMAAGTPGFQAPEQLQATNIDKGCDVYAFGAVLVELFGGKPVWPALSQYQIVTKVRWLLKVFFQIMLICPRKYKVSAVCALYQEKGVIL